MQRNNFWRKHVIGARFIVSTLPAATLITPLAPAFAQEPAPAVSSDSSTITSATTEVAAEPAGQDPDTQNPFLLSTPASDGKDTEETLTRESAKKEKSPKKSDPTASLMSGSEPPPPYHDPRHTAHVTIKADEATGALTTIFPIKTPPGRKGVEPALSLSYSSRNTDNANIAGYGWSVDIPYIERINKRGSNKLFTEYDFRSSFDDELGRKESATSTEDYGAKVETGAFRQYEYMYHAWWRVTDKQGWVYTFGTTTATQIASSTNVFRWMLEKIEDPNGNAVTYEYEKDAGQIYPVRIAYTRSAGDTGLFQVEFAKESRSDIATSSAFGFPVASRYRISEIQVKVNGNWVHKYALAYTAGDAGSRSLLSSITETGRDEDTGAMLSIPATKFTYQKSAMVWDYMEHDFDLTSLPGFSYKDTQGNTYDLGARFGDVNGDSLPDIFYGDVIVLQTGTSSWTTNHNYSLSGIPYFTSPGGSDTGTRVIDVNGDGMDDILQLYHDGNGLRAELYLNKGDGTGWTTNHGYDLSNLPVFTDGGVDQGVRIADINGDGLPDFLYLFQPSGANPPSRQAYLNKGDGTGWTTNHNYVLTGLPNFAIMDTSSHAYDTGMRIIEANGDGLPDILYGDLLFLNKGDGTGWSPDNEYDVSILPAFVSGDSDGATRILDVNGDGLDDVIRVVDNSGAPAERDLYLNKGDGTGWGHYSLNTAVGEFSIDGADVGVRIMDVNGDGLPDMLQRHQIGSGNPIRNLFLKKGERGDILSAIRSSTGATTSVLYKESAAFRDTNNKPINTRVPFALELVSEIAVIDSLSPISSTTYAYGGGEYYYNGPYEREFALFVTTSRTDALGFVTKSFYHQQGSTTQASIGEYQDHIAKKGKPYRIETYDASSNLFKKTVNSWDRAALDYQRNFVYLARSTDMTYDGDSDHKDKAETYRYDASNGNIVYKQEWGEVAASDNGSFTDMEADISGTTYAYAASSMGYLVGLPSRETVVNNASTTVKDTRFYYDSLALGSVSKGNETKREMWRSGTSWIDTEKTYNSFGLVTQEKDPRDKATNYTYDSYNLRIATSTNPVAHATGFIYDYSQGKPKRVNDPNDLIFETVYDALDRVVQQRQPDATTPGTLVAKSAYTYTDTIGSRSVQETKYLDGSVSAMRYTYLDGLNRTIQERVEAEDTATYAVKDFIYDKKGRLSRESLPYFSSGSARTASTSMTALYATTAYDALDRPTSVATAAGTTSYSYDDWKTAITDPNGNIKRFHHDAYGNLARVDEFNDSPSGDGQGGIGLLALDEQAFFESLAGPTVATGTAAHQPLEIPDSYYTGEFAAEPDTLAGAASPTADESVANGSSLESRLADKTPAQRATLKGREIVALGPMPLVQRQNYDIEIVSMQAIEGGVEVFARAWNHPSGGGGEQIGFGQDGTVDIERFRIINPPVLVPDTEGDIVRTWTDEKGVLHRRALREDPAEALLQSLEHTLSVKKEKNGSAYIIPGKIGRTPLITYPAAGANSPADGGVRNVNTTESGLTWSDIKGASSGTDASAIGAYGQVKFGGHSSSGKWRFLDRMIFMFDTSSIGEGTISAGTLSLYGDNKVNEGGANPPSLNIYTVTPQGASTLVNADYGAFGTTQLSTTISYNAFNETGYNNFPLNSVGLEQIIAAGATKFGAREATYDAGAATPAWTGQNAYGFGMRFADIG